jgi:asparagine synthase (glutamine-hydrolysing)
MCGIIGIASKYPIRDKERLLDSRDLMTYRGPDDEGLWWSNSSQIGLAHRRLSILELTKLGHQPMSDISDKLRIVFNGEIYNHLKIKYELQELGVTFHTNSDTEVILAAYKVWGFDCVKHLNGMFAFTIFDADRNSVFLARDRLGEKPLYYSLKNDAIYFSSELKPLLYLTNDNRNISYEGLNFYLSMGYVPSGNTLINNIKKLPPAHAMVFNIKTGDLKTWKFWTLPHLKNNLGSDEKVSNDVEKLLSDSVQKQLQADVPVGVLLSGGVDSSLITAMASKYTEKIKSFTVSFSGSEEFNESKHARLIANYFHTEHIELDAQRSDPQLLIDIAQDFDDPIIDSSIIPTYLVSRLVSDHCKVVLGGDGGDELFGGYRYYGRLLWLQRNIKIVPKPLLRLISKISQNHLPIGFTGKNWASALKVDFNSQLPHVTSFFDPIARRSLLEEHHFSSEPDEFFEKNVSDDQHLIQRATRMDVTNFLPEDILVKVDRSSMLNSLEVRAPFLDYKLVEYAFSEVPSSLKANHQSKKIILKSLAKKLLPKEFDRDRKQGFSVPMNDWLKEEKWKNITYDILNDSPIYNKKFINGLFKGISKGRNNGERLFGLTLFELWRKNNNLTL